MAKSSFKQELEAALAADPVHSAAKAQTLKLESDLAAALEEDNAAYMELVAIARAGKPSVDARVLALAEGRPLDETPAPATELLTQRRWDAQARVGDLRRAIPIARLREHEARARVASSVVGKWRVEYDVRAARVAAAAEALQAALFLERELVRAAEDVHEGAGGGFVPLYPHEWGSNAEYSESGSLGRFVAVARERGLLRDSGRAA